MKIRARAILHTSLAAILIIIGLLGLVLPIINGTVLLITGLIILSFEYPYIERKLFTITQRNKTIHVLYIKLEKMMRKIFRM